MEIHPIGILRCAFKEKFGLPRQPGMLKGSNGIVKLNRDPRFKAALNQLERFNYIWLIFGFHKNPSGRWRPVIDPPRDIPVKDLGVLASRSPYRPNPLGLSAVKLDRIDYGAKGGIEIHVSGIDILDQSPVFDIKPYLPYADKIEEANSGWVTPERINYPVIFSDESLQVLAQVPETRLLIEEMLRNDPRPTSQRRRFPFKDPKSHGKRFAFEILDFDVKWEIRSGAAYVYELTPAER